jgi:hypothetical protein
MLENMPFSSMDIGVCLMNVSSDGSITAGLVIEVDTVLKASISCDVDIASARNNEHSIAITRNGDNLIRRYSFFGGPDVVEKFLISSLPINKNYYLGGDRISS